MPKGSGEGDPSRKRRKQKSVSQLENLQPGEGTEHEQHLQEMFEMAMQLSELLFDVGLLSATPIERIEVLLKEILDGQEYSYSVITYAEYRNLTTDQAYKQIAKGVQYLLVINEQRQTLYFYHLRNFGKKIVPLDTMVDQILILNARDLKRFINEPRQLYQEILKRLAAALARYKKALQNETTPAAYTFDSVWGSALRGAIPDELEDADSPSL